MLDRFFEWQKSRSDPRFKSYREARLMYEKYIYGKRIQFDSLSPLQSKEALHDERLRRAENLYREAITLSHNSDALGDVATGLYQLGMLLHLQGRFSEAQKSLEESIRILEELPKTDLSKQATVSGCHYHLGIMACRKGDVDRGKQHLEKSLEIDEANSDIQGMALTRSALNKCNELVKSGIEEWKHIFETSASNVDFSEIPSEYLSSIHTEPDPDIHQQFLYSADEEKTVHDEYTEHQGKYSALTDVIWILSQSTAANDRVIDSLEKLGGQLAQNIVVSRAAFGSSNKEQSTLKPLEHDERLCAAVLIIERSGLQNENFRYWMNWCIMNVAARDDFRLYVHLEDLTIAEIERMARHGDGLLATLIDTVQLSEASSIGHLNDSLRSYLQKLDDIRRQARWHKISIISAIFIGKIATLVQLVCGVMLGIAAIAAFVFTEESVVSQLTYANELTVAVISGVVFFPLLITPMFLLFQGASVMNSMIRDVPRTRLWLILFAFLGPATIGLPQRIGVPFSYIALGLFVGVLIDITRRNGLQAKREYLSLEKAFKACRLPSLPAEVLRAIKESSFDPIQYPLFPAIAPKIFISYARSSNWSKEYALKLHTMLMKMDVQSFLDSEKIGEGSSWRNQLNRSIADANIFMSIIDRKSIDREWVAAEMITALVGKRFTGLPEIIVLMDHELPILTNEYMLPVFKAVLQEYGKPAKEGKPRIIVVKDSTLQTVLSEFGHYRYHTSSLFPSRLSLLLSYLTILPVSVGPFGVFFGPPAAIFAYLQYWDKVNLDAILSSWGILPAVFLLFGYWLGFIGRLTIASQFEVKDSNRSILAKIHAFSCIGIAAVLAVWTPNISALVIGWTFTLCYTGWLMADLFIERVERGTERKVARPDQRI